MKYIISENKFANVISLFLSKRLDSHGGLRKEKTPLLNYIFWFHEEDLMFEFNPLTKRVLADRDLWESLQSTFNLSDDEISEILKRWLVLNEDMDDDIYVVKMNRAEIKFIGEM